jgi:hypothetical protein
MKVNLPIGIPLTLIHQVVSPFPILRRLSPLRKASLSEDLNGIYLMALVLVAE